MPLSNLIFPVPDADSRDFMDEVKKLARFAPESIEAMEKDLDAKYASEEETSIGRS